MVSEVSLSETESVCISSSFIRELIFTSSHTVHHYALISVLAKLQGAKIQSGVGVAPATASFIRDSSHECSSDVSQFPESKEFLA